MVQWEGLLRVRITVRKRVGLVLQDPFVLIRAYEVAVRP